MLGPFLPSDGLPPLHINRFGVIPKGHNTGKWRLITDFSFPPRASVNEGIDPELCSLSSNLPTTGLSTDASGSWGSGALWQDAWFQIQSPPQAQALSIAEKELIPIILACDTWDQQWSGSQVQCNCDNQVVMACLRSRTRRSKGLMHLLRCFVFLEARDGFYFHPIYIPSTPNHLADDLSRDNLTSFLLKIPTARAELAPVSQPLLEALLDPQAEWTSHGWRSRFIATSRQVSPHPPRRPIRQL